MNTNPFSASDNLINEGTKAITAEIENLDKLSEQGIDILPMIQELNEKVAQLRQQAAEMVEYTFNQETANINNNNDNN